MKFAITHLKAPWPAGAAPGHVVEFPGGVPAWAVGKCVPAADDAEVFTPAPALAEAPVETVLTDAAVLGEVAPDSLADAEAQAAAERQAASKAKKAAKA